MIAEFTDPRLVAVYETVNSYVASAQPAFYSRLATEVRAPSIVDLGCGTGLITRALAGEGYRVTGVDPSPAMLEVARCRKLGDRVTWVRGGADRLPALAADLAIMSGHVAQFFLTDDGWDAALVALHGALRPGGTLAFESRDPRAREWETWTSELRRVVVDPVVGQVETWTEVDDVAAGIVSSVNHYRFVTTGEELVSRARLRFRTEDELRASLTATGFAVTRIEGDWDGRPVGPGTRELIVVAGS